MPCTSDGEDQARGSKRPVRFQISTRIEWYKEPEARLGAQHESDLCALATPCPHDKFLPAAIGMGPWIQATAYLSTSQDKKQHACVTSKMGPRAERLAN